MLDKPSDERFLSDIIQISIDDSIYSDIKWFEYGFLDINKGIKTKIPIFHLENKEHILKIEYIPKIKEKAEDKGYYIHQFNIPFWKDE